VDEASLCAALREKRIAGAGLDVYHQEPIAPENPLLKLENVILTPHTAGHTYEGWFRRSRFSWENIQRVASGHPPFLWLVRKRGSRRKVPRFLGSPQHGRCIN